MKRVKVKKPKAKQPEMATKVFNKDEYIKNFMAQYRQISKEC